MPYEPLEEKRMYKHAEALADAVWGLVMVWEPFARQTVGGQLVRATDSIGANIAEAGGRFNPGEVKTFLHSARGSLAETRYWLRRAVHRELLTTDALTRLDTDLTVLAQEINAAIRFQRTRVTAPKK